jgi:hypothetical protein
MANETNPGSEKFVALCVDHRRQWGGLDRSLYRSLFRLFNLYSLDQAWTTTGFWSIVLVSCGSMILIHKSAMNPSLILAPCMLTADDK